MVDNNNIAKAIGNNKDHITVEWNYLSEWEEKIFILIVRIKIFLSSAFFEIRVFVFIRYKIHWLIFLIKKFLRAIARK